MVIQLIVWVLFGALAGWLAFLIIGNNTQQGMPANILVGILGALIGGLVVHIIGVPGVSEFQLGSLIVAVLGSVLLLSVMQAVTPKSVK